MKSSQGFTLIETFVAITILMVGVLGPMLILSHFLIDAGQVKNRIIASLLAQEGSELVIDKIRTNLNTGTPGWLDDLSPCQSSQGCNAILRYNATNDVSFVSANDETPVTFAHDGSSANMFRRVVYVSSGSSGDPAISDSVFIRSVVTWKDRGGNERSVDLGTTMANTY